MGQKLFGVSSGAKKTIRNSVGHMHYAGPQQALKGALKDCAGCVIMASCMAIPAGC